MTKQTKRDSILELSQLNIPKRISNSVYKTGQHYIVNSVTTIYLGKLKQETDVAIILNDCAWTSKPMTTLEFINKVKLKEIERYHNDVIIYKGSLLDIIKL